MAVADLYQSVAGIEGVDDADSVLKAVLGMIASNLDEDEARRFVDRLPPEFTMELLRSERQQDAENQSADQVVGALARQFDLPKPRAQEVFREVTRAVRDACGPAVFEEAGRNLPPDWRTILG